MDLASKIQFIKKARSFEHLDDEALKVVADYATPVQFKKGDYIFREEEKPKYFHVVIKGRVKLFKISSLGRVAHVRKPERASADLNQYDKAAIGQVLEGQSGALSQGAVNGVLEAAGFKLPRQMEVFKREDLVLNCAQVGFPLAMKVIGPLHKTDVGGVKLGIANNDDARRSWDNMLTIENAEGVLLQPMIGGIEVILGASREGDFGHLIMFGLGGIYTEVLKDVQFALAPLTKAESRRMIHGIRSYAILEGVRGEAGMDIDVLADHVQRLSLLVHDFPQIDEIDLNPIRGIGVDLYAVDARIILNG